MQHERLLMQTLHIHNYGSSFLKAFEAIQSEYANAVRNFLTKHHIEHLHASLKCRDFFLP